MSDSSRPEAKDDPRNVRSSSEESERTSQGWSTEDMSSQDQMAQAEAPADPADDEPKKKRYYSPNEVMKKKGCIGCGGMALALVVIPLALAAVLAIL